MDWFSNLPSGNSVHQELGEIAIVRAEPIVPEKIRADLFARHQGIPGHQQLALESARILMAGAGGLNSWSGLSLVRAGAKHLTIADHDLVELSNLPRQLFFSGDEGEPKAVRLAHHLAQHAVGGATIVGI